MQISPLTNRCADFGIRDVELNRQSGDDVHRRRLAIPGELGKIALTDVQTGRQVRLTYCSHAALNRHARLISHRDFRVKRDPSMGEPHSLRAVAMYKTPMNETDYGTIIRERRTALKLQQRALANRVNVAQGFISEIEAGKKRPSLELLEKIADALKMSPANFWQRDEAAAHTARTHVVTDQQAEFNATLGLRAGDVLVLDYPDGLQKGDIILTAELPNKPSGLAVIAQHPLNSDEFWAWPIGDGAPNTLDDLKIEGVVVELRRALRPAS